MKQSLFFILLLIAAKAVAQPAGLDVAKMDSLLIRTARANKASGIVLLEKNGKVLYQRGFGNAVQGARASSVNASTRFRIGSITKTFTAAMIFQLIDEKKLRLDSKLSEFYPTVPNAARISIDQLLTHQSGLHNFTDDTSYGGLSAQPISQAAMLKLISSQSPDFEPGAQSAYSNTNFVLLGWIVEKLRNTDYATALKKYITDPIGLKTVQVFKAAPEKDDALSYEWSSGQWNATTLTHPTVPGGAGSISATAADLAAFLDALFAGKIVSPGSLADMQRISGRMGRGLFRIPWGARGAWGHGGHIDAYNSMAARFPDDSLTIVQLTNGSSINTNDLTIGVLSIFYGDSSYQVPDYSEKIVVLDEALLEQYVGTYTFPQANMDIAITRHGTVISAQATGQPAFDMKAIAKDEFTFDEAGIRIQFDAPVGGKSPAFTLYQGGSVVPFERKP